jgi:hypothetical protein
MMDAKAKVYDFHGALSKQSLVSSGFIPGAIASLIPTDSFTINKNGAPTFVGKKTADTITLRELLLDNGVSVATLNALTGTFATNLDKPAFILPGGADLPTVPFPLVFGANIGLPYKVQLGVRYLPTVNVPSGIGKSGLLGLKAQYEFTQWIPVVGSLPLLHTSAMYAFDRVTFGDILKLNNWTTMLNVSGDFKFLMGLGLYGGVGFEGSTMNLDYTVPATAGPLAGTKVSLQDKGDNFFKAQVGVRFSFLIFDLFGDATFGKTNSYFAGIGLGFNNL